MKKILSLILALTLLLGTVLTLASCGAPENDGAQIAVYLGDPIYDFDPTDYYTDNNAEQLMSLLFEPLFTLNEKGEIKYAAASKYSVDKENREITITLRESYWSDGARVTADDFLYSWRDHLLEPTKANPAAALLYDIENAMEVKQGKLSNSELAIEANLYELKITYREGADYNQLLKNLASTACSPIRQGAVTAAPAYWSKNANSIVTNGPFIISTLSYPDGELTLERNIGYRQAKDTTDYDNNVVPHKLVTFFTVDGYTVDCSYEDIENKTVFYMGDMSIVDRKDYSDKAVVTDTLSTYSYVFNTKNPLFAIPEVRRALSIAVDRDAIAAEVVFGKAATGFLSPMASKNVAQTLIDGKAKMDEARKILSGVDLSEMDLAFTITVNNDEVSRKIADIVKNNWAQLGFNVSVKYAGYIVTPQFDYSTGAALDIYDSEIQYLVKEASVGNCMFDVIAVDWQMFSSDPFVALSSFTSNTNGNGADIVDSDVNYRPNISGWTNDKYNSYLSAAYKTTDASKRNENLKKAEALLVSEAPIVPILFNQSFYVASDEIENVKIDGLGHIVFSQVTQKDYEAYLPEEE